MNNSDNSYNLQMYKEFNVGQMLDFVQSKILKEVAKCELVCSNYHRKRTHARKQRTNLQTA